jgi:hypothetical protein
MHWSGKAAHFNKPFAAVFLDMSKAFHLVRHDVLLARLIDVGIPRGAVVPHLFMALKAIILCSIP